MDQKDNTASGIGDTSVFAEADADKYIADIKAYQQTIQGILDIFLDPKKSLVDILESERLKIYETQIMDVLKYINKTPMPGGVSFEYKANVQQNLNNARIQLTKVIYLLNQPPLVAVEGFDFILPFQEYLNLAASMMLVTKEA